ncbi:hypothetical protein ACOI1C_22470 [Bacillus sp. DJP31]|uniref:hypothetical protein n=1 Tax=Bacillus sp. DJP31 TaxID=3409789 RepID=UPI003BB6DCBD
MPNHFGVKVSEGKRDITREKYAVVSKKNSLVRFSADIYEDEDGKFYSDDWYQQLLKDSLTNYDLNIFITLFERNVEEKIIIDPVIWLIKIQNIKENENYKEYLLAMEKCIVTILG